MPAKPSSTKKSAFQGPSPRISLGPLKVEGDVDPLFHTTQVAASMPLPEWCEADQKLKIKSNEPVFIDNDEAAAHFPAWIEPLSGWDRASAIVSRRLPDAEPVVVGDKGEHAFAEIPRASFFQKTKVRDLISTLLFESIATYGQAPGWPLLWDALYPRDENGPVYNSKGKYHVKLWVSGKWRKLEIDDRIPVNADGVPIIASFEDSSQIWPSLLAKALYKLFALLEHEETIENFVSCSIRALAGWLPSFNKDVIEHLPVLTLEDVTLISTDRLPKSDPDGTSPRRRRRRNTEAPSTEALEAASTKRNDLATHIRTILHSPRDQLVFVATENDEPSEITIDSLLSVVVDDQDPSSKDHLLLKWHCLDSKPEDFTPLQHPPNPDYQIVSSREVKEVTRMCCCPGLEHFISWDRSWVFRNDVFQPPPPAQPTLLCVEKGLLVLCIEADATAPAVLTLEEMSRGAKQVPPVFLRLELPSKNRYVTTTTQTPGGIYRLHLDAPHGALVTFASALPLAVGSLQEVYQNKLGLGFVQEFRGELAVVPAGASRILFRRMVKTEDVSFELWLSEDPFIRKFVRLHTLNIDDDKEKDGIWHPLLETTTSSPCDNRGVVITAVITAPSWRALPSTAWTLFARSASQNPSIGTIDDKEAPFYARYGGVYKPNIHLRLFRDVLTFTPPGFISMTTNSVSCFLQLRIYDGDGESLVFTAKGLGSIVVPCIWTSAGQTPSSYIFEAFIDSDVMDVPEEFRSVKPYTAENGTALLEWQLEIASPRPDIEMRPDPADLAAHAELRKKWEAAEPGRAERAASIRAQYLALKSKCSSSSSSLDGEGQDEAAEEEKKKSSNVKGGSSLGDARIRALGSKIVDADTELLRQALRKTLPAAVVEMSAPGADATGAREDNEADTVVMDKDSLMKLIADAAETSRQDYNAHAAALRAWREAVTEKAQVLLAAREAYRLQEASKV